MKRNEKTGTFEDRSYNFAILIPKKYNKINASDFEDYYNLPIGNSEYDILLNNIKIKDDTTEYPSFTLENEFHMFDYEKHKEAFSHFTIERILRGKEKKDIALISYDKSYRRRKYNTPNFGFVLSVHNDDYNMKLTDVIEENINKVYTMTKEVENKKMLACFLQRYILKKPKKVEKRINYINGGFFKGECDIQLLINTKAPKVQLVDKAPSEELVTATKPLFTKRKVLKRN